MFRCTCQNCHRNYIPNSQNRDVTRLVCGKELCPNCNRNHFCPDHWNLLPTEVQIALLKLTEDAKRKQMVTFAIMAVGMVAIMLTFVLFAVNGLVFVGLGIFFGGFILLALLMFPAVFSQKGSKIKVRRNYSKNGVFVGTASNRSFTTKSNRHANFPTQYSDFNRNN